MLTTSCHIPKRTAKKGSFSATQMGFFPLGQMDGFFRHQWLGRKPRLGARSGVEEWRRKTGPEARGLGGLWPLGTAVGWPGTGWEDDWKPKPRGSEEFWHKTKEW